MELNSRLDTLADFPIMEREILRIKALIDELRAVDTEFRIFGANLHRYRIGPSLNEVQLREYETKHDLVLPTDYRLYLQLVGSGSGESGIGGAGPAYGLYALDETLMGSPMNKPFPLEEGACLGPRPQGINPLNLPHVMWEGGVPGLLEIGTIGCDYMTHLIVYGPQYGMIWESWEYRQFWPTGFTFSQWMRDWAEKSLAEVRGDNDLIMGKTRQT